MKLRYLIYGFMILGIPVLLGGTPSELRFIKNSEVPDFFFATTVMATEDTGKSEIVCYTKIPYDKLQFLKEGEMYKARYELSFTLFDPKGVPMDGKVGIHEVVVSNYGDTNSRELFHMVETRFLVSPGTYQLMIAIMDFDSRKTSIRKTPVLVPRRSPSSLWISEPILAESIKIDSTGKSIPVPNVVNNFSSLQDTLFLWFEVYSPIEWVRLPVKYQIQDIKGTMVREEHMEIPLTPPRTVCSVPIPKGDLKGGRYKLFFTAGEGTFTFQRTIHFSIHWLSMPNQIQDLDKAIEQLRYIAKGSEIKRIKKLQGDEKLAAFFEFWKKYDPSPGTEENELMDEYYRRVEFANQNFSTFLEGWRTDRGMVYILLGPPNEVERHPFESGTKPYEIWMYYSINRYFLFIDTTGLGDYRLEGSFWNDFNEIF